MKYWEFLIQREGDRGWRTIETGNLQLHAGRYRIVANSDVFSTPIKTRVTHQTSGVTVPNTPKQRSQSRVQSTNQRGLLAILPFTDLQPGIWQFICSDTTAAPTQWRRVLKLRVLSPVPGEGLGSNPLNRSQSAPLLSTELLPPLATTSVTPKATTFKSAASTHSTPILPTTTVDRFTLPAPTKPIVPISLVDHQQDWTDGLDRLLEQLERESLEPQPLSPKASSLAPGQIQIRQLATAPAQLVSLDRSTFAGVIPGSRLTISGTCNLNKLDGKLIKTAKIAKLSICLRHPQTSNIIGSIEQSLPNHLDTFAFRGDLELPIDPQINFLVGEVNLYDKHYIQLGAGDFTITLSLDSISDNDFRLFQLEDRSDSTGELLAQLTAELQLETATMTEISASRSTVPNLPAEIQASSHSRQQYSTPEITGFTYPGIVPVNLASPTAPTVDITGDLEIDFALTSFGSLTPVSHHQVGNPRNLEIVIDD